MTRLTGLGLGTFVALFVGGCQGSPTRPSVAGMPVAGLANAPAPVAALAVEAPPVAAAAVNCDFDRITAAFKLGIVTINNQSTCANDFTVASFRIVNATLADQIYLGQVSARLAPGESKTLTIPIPDKCDFKIQQDMWVGVDPSVTVQVGTGERWWSHERTPECGVLEPPVTAPPPVSAPPPVTAPPAIPQPPSVCTVNCEPPSPPPSCRHRCDPKSCHREDCEKEHCHSKETPPKQEDKDKKHCNQGVGNGNEGCDPGNSNQGDDSKSNDEHGGVPGAPGRGGSHQ